jgi:DHA2 family multidrug resistance protein-like MFS transporter
MQDSTPGGPGPRAGRREWIGLAVLALPTLLVALDAGVLFLAMPAVSADLGASSVQQLWLTDIYGFLIAGFLITMGTLGDRIGRRKLLLIGGTAFALASVLAAYSPNADTLILARALLGIAGATLMPSTLALISNMFANAKQRGTAISLWAMCQFGGSALGPVIGGVLLRHFWWGSVFLLGVPVMALLLILGPIFLPEYRNENPGRFDLISVVLSLTAILPAVWGVKELAAGDSGNDLLPIAALVVGLMLGVLFVRRQFKLETPLLDLSLFRRRQVGAILTTMLLTGAFMAGTGMLVSQYFQLVLGQSTLAAAIWYAPMGLALAIGCVLTPTVVRSISPRTAMTIGLVLGVVGFVLVALVDSTSGLALASLGLGVVAFGDGPLVSLGTGIVVGAVPPERAGAAASTSETFLNLGATLGIALLGTIGAAFYRSGVVGAIPASLPPAAATDAHETLAGARDAASLLDPATAHDFLATARIAFTDGVNAAAWIGAIGFVLLAVLVAKALKDKKDTVAEQSDGTEQDVTEEALQH